MLTKNNRDLPLSEITAENYLVPKGEELFFHTMIDQSRYSPDTGKKISVERIQIFGRNEFPERKRDLEKQRYTVTILHNPNEWVKEQSILQEKMKKDMEEKMETARREAEEKRLEDERLLKEAEEIRRQKEIEEAIKQGIAEAKAKEEKEKAEAEAKAKK